MKRIAIVGMSCRLPGADSPQALWDLVSRGVDAVSDVPSSRWDSKRFYDEDPKQAGKMYTTRGGFIDQLEDFDAFSFGISPREILHMDPQQRLMLELAWEALEDAGIPQQSLGGSATGVFFGFGVMEYALTQLRYPELIDAYTNTGYFPCIIANRVSYFFDLRGPSLSLDTACSSSLVAVHLACESLRSGECNLAMAGGVSLMVDPLNTVAFCKLSALSPKGRCKTFDAGADGYVRGEGAGVITLKRLEDAIADGDRIYAVIRGEAVNQDGKSNGLTAPNRLSQESVLRQAYQNAQYSPADVQYIEAHGTGTFLGDPIELTALGNVMREGRDKSRPLLVGSLKTNIGHLEAAAGIAGLIKLAKCVEHKQIPPHLHFEVPNPHIPFESLQVQVASHLQAWPEHDGVAVAGISAFGFGGTNAHVVVEEFVAPNVASTGKAGNSPFVESSDCDPAMLLITAKDPNALSELRKRYVELLADDSVQIGFGEIANCAAYRRSYFEFRSTLVASDCKSASEALSIAESNTSTRRASNNPKLAFLFTGQGSQYVGMGRQLYHREAIFRDVIDNCDEMLRSVVNGSLRDVIFADDSKSPKLDQTAFTQPAMFALQWALVELWKAWGVQPSLVLGHSIGELAGACAAGLMSWESGLIFAAKRGALMQSLSQLGQMLAVLESRVTTCDFIDRHSLQLCIAASNGPKNTVLSGSNVEIERASACARADRMAAVRLNVSHAFHSQLMEPILESLLKEASEAKLAASRIPFISNLTGEIVDAGSHFSPSYFKVQARSEVRFEQCVETLVEWQPDVCLEIGSDSLLIEMLKRCNGGKDLISRPSLRRDQDSLRTMLGALGAAFEAGVSINLPAVYGPKRRVVPLPKYPFQRTRYWESLPILTPGSSTAVDSPALMRTDTKEQHPLLGSRADSAITLFCNTVSATHPTWLADHKLTESIVLPGAGFIEMAMCAVNSGLDAQDQIQLGDVQFLQPVILSQTNKNQLQCSVQQGFISIASKSSDISEPKWQTVASAKFGDQPNVALDVLSVDVKLSIDACDQQLPSHSLYESLSTIGLNYGPAFRRVERLWLSQEEVWGEIRVDDIDQDSGFHFSPMVLDACFHVVAAAINANIAEIRDCYVPVAIENVTLKRCSSDRVYVRVTSVNWEAESRTFVSNFDIFLPSGVCVGSVSKNRFAKFVSPGLKTTDEQNLQVWKPTWKRLEVLSSKQKNVSKQVTLISDNFSNAGLLRRELGVFENAWTIEQLVNSGDLKDTAIYNTSDLGRTVLIVLDLETDEIADAAIWERVQDQCKKMHDWLVSNAKSTSDRQVVLLTRGAHSIGEDDAPITLASCCVAGWFRSVRLEMTQWRCEHIDLDRNRPLSEQMSLVARWLQSETDNFEIAWRDSEAYVRVVDTIETPVTSPETKMGNCKNQTLGFSAKGSLDYLNYLPSSRPLPGPDEIEIQVRSTGLNFRDVLNVLGVYPGDAGPLGGECAGYISSVGENVRELQVGEPVVAISGGSFSRYAIANASLATRKPQHLSFAEASCLPVASLTASIALKHFGGIKRGDRALIHAAAGGVGLAAVRIALRVGAEVYATAGSDVKREHLRSLGVAHIADSRSTDFDQDITQALDGQKLDIVLNSLTGDFIPRSLKLVKEGGRFIEIGKIGTWTAEDVARHFPAVCYQQFDIAEWAKRDPLQLGRMLREEIATYQNVSRRPLVKSFAIDRAEDAFRFMSQGKHMGKIAVVQPHNPQVNSESLFEASATYIVTGGLGAIGRNLLEWMTQHGARQVELIIHRSLRDDERTLVESWQRRDLNINCHRMDATDPGAVVNLVAKLNEGSKPIRGVFHLAGVLRDGLAEDSEWEDYNAVLSAKSLIAWNIHLALRENDLHYFVLFSSIATLLGSPGQSSYSAANAFLDGLAVVRRHEGLPALSIQWGPWAGDGMADKFHDRGNQLGLYGLNAKDAWTTLGKLMRTDAVQACVAEFDTQKFSRTIGTKLSSALVSSMQSQSKVFAEPKLSVNIEQWAAHIRSANDTNRHAVILDFLMSTARDVLGLPDTTRFDVRQPLRELGLDSLMAVEMKNILSDVTHVTLDSTVLFDYPTIEALAKLLNDQLSTVTGAEVDIAKTATSAEFDSSNEDIAVQLAKALASLELNDSHPL